MKWYDYDYLEEIEVRREDQQLYKFKEGDFPKHHLFSDGMLTSVRSVLHDYTSNLRMDYLPKRRWSSLDTKEVSHHDQGYRSAAARKKVNEELGKVRWWERLRGRPMTTSTNHMILSYVVLIIQRLKDGVNMDKRSIKFLCDGGGGEARFGRNGEEEERRENFEILKSEEFAFMSPPTHEKFRWGMVVPTRLKCYTDPSTGLRMKRMNRKCRIPIDLHPCRVEEKLIMRKLEGKWIRKKEMKMISKDGTISEFLGYTSSKDEEDKEEEEDEDEEEEEGGVRNRIKL
ncbi:hypothetical protein Tco_0670394 [Tanacetum coccineum]